MAHLRHNSSRDPRQQASSGASRQIVEHLVMVADVDLGRADATRTHTLEVAREFARAGLGVELVARGPDPQLENVVYRRAGGSHAPLSIRLFTVNGRSIATLLRMRPRARLCYVRFHWSETPLLLAARVLGYRVVTQVDDVPFGRGFLLRSPGPRGFITDHVKRGAARIMGCCAHGVVAVTGEIKEILVTDFHFSEKKIRVLPNGADIDFFVPIRRNQAITRSALDPSCQYLVFVGHFAAWVDFDTMLGAFALVVGEHRRARLVLVGDGSQRPHIESLIESLGLQGKVQLTGFVRNRERVRDLIGAATVCLAAHRGERNLSRIGTSPVKVAEYFASGRPVVAIAVPNIREMIEENRAGIAVQPDPKAMASALSALLADEARVDEMGARARTAAEERYSWRSVVSRTIPLFRGDA
jgi:glycosyltransferase involved in cell wall biosynthesis